MEEDPETIAREVARALRAGRRAVAFTGAGAPPEQVAAVHGTVLEEICAGCGRPLPDCARVHPCCGYPRPAALLFHDAIHPAAASAGAGGARDLVHALQGADTPLLF